ncbi:hypothetical protein R3P38DRAFT_1179895 [Favolaschia claudopus]|uniref:F-box domain-containing protein n=1 Tax=Favolaschia claudopus TaxID=2862362 RepID=A0AAW0E1L0_9AGAR
MASNPTRAMRELEVPNLNEFDRQVKNNPSLKRDWRFVYGFIKKSTDNCRNIHLEMERLRSENSQLKQENNSLLEKVAIYRRAARADYSAFPDEILLAIFRAALPPAWLLYGTRSVAPYALDMLSLDIRTKCSIAAVCKSWNRVGTELLYGRIILRRITQLPALACALENRPGLGALVKHLDVNCFAPRGYTKLHHGETQRVLELCPKLSHIGFSPPSVIPQLPFSIPMINSSVTSLEFGLCIPYPSILPILKGLSPYLKSLSFTIPGVSDQEHPAITFPTLEDLHLTVTKESVVGPHKWLAPKLRRLWIWEILRQSGLGFRPIVNAYGRSIIFLRIHSTSCANIQQLLDCCPILEYLTINSSPKQAMAHKNVKFVDIICAAILTINLSKDNFPALECCRNLMWVRGALQYIPQIPWDAPKAIYREFTDPRSVNGGAFIRFSSYDLSNNEESDVSVSDYASDSDEEDLLGSNDSERDSDYASDSDGASCITVSDTGCLLDEFYQEEQWEIGRDEALVVFSRTRS